MVSVFVALMTGLACQSLADLGVIEVDLYDINYELYRCIRALIYSFFAVLIMPLAYCEMKNEKNFNAIVICILSLCMCITCIFDILMSVRPLFETLNYYRVEASICWMNIYRAIELLTVIAIIGRVGFDFFTDFINSDRANDSYNSYRYDNIESK